MIDEARHVALLRVSLRNCAERMLVTEYRPPSHQKKALYRRIALKTLLLLGRCTNASSEDCAAALKLLLATNSQAPEHVLLDRLIAALAHLLQAQEKS
jgi:hypothetical protein